MANLIEIDEFTAGIHQFEVSEPPEGGINGIDNVPTRQLANRTKYLNARLQEHGQALNPHTQYILAAIAATTYVRQDGNAAINGTVSLLDATQPNQAVALGQADGRFAPKSILTKLARLVVDVEDFGAIGNGADDSLAFQAALSAVGVLGGGQVRAAKRYLIDQALSIPNHVHLMGVLARPGEILPATSANYSTVASVLTVNPAITITTGHGSSISGFVVLRKGLVLPFADAATAAAGLAAFAGVPFTVGGFDNKFSDLLVLGFNQVLSSINQSRIICDRIYGDNNNGIFIQGCWDIARIDNCHMWPWTTVHQAWTTNALLRRPGHAYEMVNGGDWNKLTDSFSYGYNWGTAIRSCNNVMIVGGGADNTSTAGVGDNPGAFGLLVDGASRQTHVVGFTAAAQAQGYYINTLAGCQTQIRDSDAHGIAGAGVYINSGDVVIDGNFIRSVANAVQVNNAASIVDIDNNQFDVINGLVVNATAPTTNVRIGGKNQYGNMPANSAMVQNMNAIPAIATASTLALPLRGDTFMLTGSVSFGSMGGQWPDREVVLIATAPVIALHSIGAQTLCLKAKANLTMAANDTLTLRHNGSMWYQI